MQRESYRSYCLGSSDYSDGVDMNSLDFLMNFALMSNAGIGPNLNYSNSDRSSLIGVTEGVLCN